MMPACSGCENIMNNERLQSKPERASIYWVHEAIVYLGFDRLGLTRPEKAVYRLVSKGVLNPRKINGHFSFDKKELDKLLANGDQKPRRGRPKKYHSA